MVAWHLLLFTLVGAAPSSLRDRSVFLVTGPSQSDVTVWRLLLAWYIDAVGAIGTCGGLLIVNLAMVALGGSRTLGWWLCGVEAVQEVPVTTYAE